MMSPLRLLSPFAWPLPFAPFVPFVLASDFIDDYPLPRRACGGVPLRSTATRSSPTRSTAFFTPSERGPGDVCQLFSGQLDGIALHAARPRRPVDDLVEHRLGDALSAEPRNRQPRA